MVKQPTGNWLSDWKCIAKFYPMPKCFRVPVLFSAVNGIAARLVTNKSLQTVLSVMLEVCGAVTRSAGHRPMWVIAFSVGFGGICVHCQIFGILDGIAVRKPLFFLIRIIQGTLTALLTQGAMCLFPQTVSVFSTASGSAPALFGGSAVPGAVLLAVRELPKSKM